MSQFTREDLLHIAELARLEIPESEIEARLREFNEIVAYVEKLSELNTKGIVPTSQVTEGAGRLGTPFGEDIPAPSFQPDTAVQNAPDRQDHFFKVPRMIDDTTT
ncbi:MAG TPA: Asp-tRNA(Asn)/Glu-tRNA(Gln) amidotransferase subunit GatC [Bdellovibrionota bacterium]|nr:Asp-tRNA(Asn)/Glu-tRNA(Gln) amidotransferase subunit GatC [Bdellovibrionota bacterium]